MKYAALVLLTGMLRLANAGPVTWYLHGVHYGGLDGLGVPGYSIGHFTYDADLNVVTEFSITDLGLSTLFPSSWPTPNPGPDTGPGITSPTSITLTGVDDRLVGICSPPCGGGSRLQMVFQQPLTDAGGTVALIPYDLTSQGSEESIHINPAGRDPRYVSEGFVSTDGPSTTPEPSTLSGVILTLVCAGALRLQRYSRRSKGLSKAEGRCVSTTMRHGA